MRVAAYQAPLLPAGCMDALELIRMQVKRCERDCIRILCCPEAILGGLADNHTNPYQFAITTVGGNLKNTFLPLASDTVTSIVGFSELGNDGRLYNSAAVFQQGEVVGVYRKLHPAIRRSVYLAGLEVRVFTIGELTFGIVICNDSNYPELATLMAKQGATALFVPTNNALPPQTNGVEVIAKARECDMLTAMENTMWVIRADVVGNAGGLASLGSSEIVNPEGVVVQVGDRVNEGLLIGDIATIPRKPRNQQPLTCVSGHLE